MEYSLDLICSEVHRDSFYGFIGLAKGIISNEAYLSIVIIALFPIFFLCIRFQQKHSYLGKRFWLKLELRIALTVVLLGCDVT
jgi:hypothetical protein